MFKSKKEGLEFILNSAEQTSAVLSPERIFVPTDSTNAHSLVRMFGGRTIPDGWETQGRGAALLYNQFDAGGYVSDRVAQGTLDMIEASSNENFLPADSALFADSGDDEASESEDVEQVSARRKKKDKDDDNA